jgi:cytochrome c oxidase subunit 2
MDGMVCFHQKTMVLVGFIVFSVGFFLVFCVVNFLKEAEVRAPGRFTHNTLAEVLWTAIPTMLLAILIVPSFALLFSIEELPDPQGTLKCQGRQWHWCYEYRDFRSSRGKSPSSVDRLIYKGKGKGKSSYPLFRVDNTFLG